MRKLGFTLIELLATIVIIAVIAIIAVPTVLGVIESSQKSSFKESVRMTLQSSIYYAFENDLEIFPSDGILASDLNMKNSSQFLSGTVIKNNDGQYEAIRVTNGKYCVSGITTNLTLVDECYMLDTTAPDLDETNIYTISTSNSIKVIVPKEAITELESNIKSYTFELINEELSVNEKVTVSENNYTFKSLNNETEYKIIVTLTNENDLTTTKEITAKTSIITPPTYSIDTTGFSTSKTVTITYPERKEGYIYTYTVDSGNTWEIVDSTTKDVIFNSNGTIIARIYDGTNYVTASSYTVTGIDTTAPSASLAVSSKTAQATLTATCSDSESGITKYEYSKDNGSTWVANGTTASYTFTGLTSTTSYTYAVRCTNGSALTTTSTSTASTLGMTNPTIAQSSQTPSSGYSYATSRVIGITYTSTNIASPVYYFKSSVTATVTSGVVTASCGPSTNPGTCTTSSVTTLVAGTWYKTSSMTPTVTYEANGTLFALTSDGTNVSGTATYAIANMDKTKPSASLAVSSVVSSSTVTSTVTATCADSESGITKYEYSKDNGSTWVAKGTTKTHAFTDLSVSTNYTFGARCTNGSGLVSSVATTTVTTPSVCAYSAGQVWNYAYTGGTQTFTAPCAGTYKLEVWGAQGSSVNSGTGGLGGYSYGNITLTINTVLSLNVGVTSNHTGATSRTFSSGKDANGKTHSGTQYIGAGGALTSIVKSGTTLIVAGGGGGGVYGTDSTDGTFYNTGGTGGGTTGGAGGTGGFGDVYISRVSSGGTQSSVGLDASLNYSSTTIYGGAGGGYYRGGQGAIGSDRGYAIVAGGGGSGYIGGVSSGSMTNGSRSGNGYARITLVAISG
ncbi:MAG: glycine-rich protein [Bacilli bacterium]